jgi:hypothetical protein
LTLGSGIGKACIRLHWTWVSNVAFGVDLRRMQTPA